MLVSTHFAFFQHSTRICEHSGIAVTMPHLCYHQRNRSNPVGSSIEDFFKETVAIPFLNHLISNVSFQFDAHTKQAASLQRIIPSLITTNLSHYDISEGVGFYSDDLPNATIVDEELSRWKSRWLAVPEKDRPQSLSAALKQCQLDTFPNIFTLLKLFATIPLSSCLCERSVSALRRLNNYLWCSQTEERLSALTFVHCNSYSS